MVNKDIKEAVLYEMYRQYCKYNNHGNDPSFLSQHPFPFNFPWVNPNLKPLCKSQQHSHVIMKDLKTSGYLSENKVKYHLTDKGFNLVEFKLNPPEDNSPSSKTRNWQNNIPVYITVGIIIVVIGGFLLHKIISSS